MHRLVGLLGIFVFVGIAYLLSSNKKAIDWRTIIWGMVLQVVMALVVLGIPAWHIPGPLHTLFDAANNAVMAILDYTQAGSEFVFGSLAVPSKSTGFIFAFMVLPSIIFISSLMAVSYHLGIMQKVVLFFAVIMRKTMRISGAESLSTAANIFVGQTEAPLLIKPYVETMTRSELLCIMIGGMANTAGGVLAAYVGLLRDQIPDIAGHLITASVMSAPATIVIAKLLIPETGKPTTEGSIPKKMVDMDQNVIESAARGASEGVLLAVNVAGMLLAFIALVALMNGVFGWIGGYIHFENWGRHFTPELFLRNGEPVKLSLQLILGWLFSPLAWLMGIPWKESAVAGALLGEKIVLNEFVAYVHLAKIDTLLDVRTSKILSYALCGFANFSSIAIQLGGIGSLAPNKKKDLAQLGLIAVVGGSLATFLIATIAGILF